MAYGYFYPQCKNWFWIFLFVIQKWVPDIFIRKLRLTCGYFYPDCCYWSADINIRISVKFFTSVLNYMCYNFVIYVGLNVTFMKCKMVWTRGGGSSNLDRVRPTASIRRKRWV